MIIRSHVTYIHGQSDLRQSYKIQTDVSPIKAASLFQETICLSYATIDTI